MNRHSLLFAAGGLSAAVASGVAAPGWSGLFGASLALLMAAIAYEDWRDFIIPDLYAGLAIVLALAAAFVTDTSTVAALIDTLLRAALLATAFLAIRVGFHRIRGHHGLGLGDVKLAGVAGAWLDWTSWPVAIEIAALSALAAALLYKMITRERLRADTRLPFGLFFAPAIWIAWLIKMLEGPQGFA